MVMKIITLNTWGTSGPYEKRWSLLLNELNKLKPDILCLQEVFNVSLMEKIRNEFGLIFTHSPESGLAIASRFPIRSCRAFIYKARSPIEDYNRGALLNILEIDSEPLLIATTHLSWKPEDTKTRYVQVNELLHLIQNEKLPTILSGDFNDVPESKPLEKIVNSGFADIFKLNRPTEIGMTWDNQNPFMKEHSVTLPDRRIDFLFADQSFLKKWPVRNCEVIFNRSNSENIYTSDHYGVLAEFN